MIKILIGFLFIGFSMPAFSQAVNRYNPLSGEYYLDIRYDPAVFRNQPSTWQAENNASRNEANRGLSADTPARHLSNPAESRIEGPGMPVHRNNDNNSLGAVGSGSGGSISNPAAGLSNYSPRQGINLAPSGRGNPAASVYGYGLRSVPVPRPGDDGVDPRLIAEEERNRANFSYSDRHNQKRPIDTGTWSKPPANFQPMQIAPELSFPRD